MMDGLWLVFYPEGQLAARAQYDMGRGKQIGYSKEGIIMLEVHFLDNVKHGKEIHYAPDGTVVEVIEYEHGEKVVEKEETTE
jgi:antitoxin component YwqK of YwqJK toxin-antitoxin module